MQLIAQGAEAKILSDQSTVKKERFEKTYRHPKLDSKLRKFRTRREAKILTKLAEEGFPSPKLIDMDDSTMEVRMEHVPGKMVKEVINEDNCKALCSEIGKNLAMMHNMGIIHHDLTTSNMILHEKEKKVYFIDFGLSFFSEKIEDKAVDLHLLRHALESRHHQIAGKCFEAVEGAYLRHADSAEQVMTRLESVEKRGRYKSKHK
jgi:Kae1-associated kinase Bud32